VKVLRNVAFNPISALTEATLAAMARDPGVTALVRSIMAEVEAVVELAEPMGIPMPHTSTVYACARLLGATNAGINAKTNGGRRQKA
jgi:ketopantoate reductase